MSPDTPLPIQLPKGEVVETVWIRLPNGKLVPRRADEIIKRPTPPTLK